MFAIRVLAFWFLRGSGAVASRNGYTSADVAKVATAISNVVATQYLGGSPPKKFIALQDEAGWNVCAGDVSKYSELLVSVIWHYPGMVPALAFLAAVVLAVDGLLGGLVLDTACKHIDSLKYPHVSRQLLEKSPQKLLKAPGQVLEAPRKFRKSPQIQEIPTTPYYSLLFPTIPYYSLLFPTTTTTTTLLLLLLLLLPTTPATTPRSSR